MRSLAVLLAAGVLCACSDGETVFVPFPPLDGATSVIVGVETSTDLTVYAHAIADLEGPLVFSDATRVQALVYSTRSLTDLGLDEGLVLPAEPGEPSRSLDASDEIFEWQTNAEGWTTAELSTRMHDFELPETPNDCLQLVDFERVEVQGSDSTSTGSVIPVDDHRVIVLSGTGWYLFSTLDRSVTPLDVQPPEHRPRYARKGPLGNIVGATGYSVFSVTLDLAAGRVDAELTMTATGSSTGFVDIAFADNGWVFLADATGRVLAGEDATMLSTLFEAGWPSDSRTFLDTVESGDVAMGNLQSSTFYWLDKRGAEARESPTGASPSAFAIVEGSGRILADVAGSLFVHRTDSWGLIGETPDHTIVKTLLPYGPRRFLMGGELGLLALFDDARQCTISRDLGMHVRDGIQLGDGHFVMTGSPVGLEQATPLVVFELSPGT